MCCFLLVCAVLKTLHSVKHILNEEECRSIGKARGWWLHELAVNVVIVVKPPGAVLETLHGCIGGIQERLVVWYDC